METITLNGKSYQIGFKVVTKDMKSLGLRKNPNIIQFPVRQWYFLSDEQLLSGKSDWGGIWVARTHSNARRLKEYMAEKYSQKTRIFRTAIDKVLYSNSYRVKTNGVNLLEELA